METSYYESEQSPPYKSLLKIPEMHILTPEVDYKLI